MNPNARILLGSGGFRTPERVRNLHLLMRAHFGDLDQLLFIPYAMHDHDKYVHALTERGLNADYELVGIHRCPDPRAAIFSAQAIYVGGGNTFRLLHSLYQLDLLDALRQRVQAGIPYLGISAGANIAGPTIMTTNDMPIVQPPSFDALGLVPYQINPHYYAGENWLKQGETFVPHFGETRDARIREFHEMNETPVLGLWEGATLRCEGGKLRLHDAPARIFYRGQAALDVMPGDINV